MTGPLLVIRTDQRPLHPAHVVALAEYCDCEGYTDEQLSALPEGVRDADLDGLIPFLDPNF
jgi:hypothetical protein